MRQQAVRTVGIPQQSGQLARPGRGHPKRVSTPPAAASHSRPEAGVRPGRPRSMTVKEAPVPVRGQPATRPSGPGRRRSPGRPFYRVDRLRREHGTGLPPRRPPRGGPRLRTGAARIIVSTPHHQRACSAQDRPNSSGPIHGTGHPPRVNLTPASIRPGRQHFGGHVHARARPVAAAHDRPQTAARRQARARGSRQQRLSPIARDVTPGNAARSRSRVALRYQPAGRSTPR